MAAVEASIFLRLPIEILELILRQLDLADLKALRSANRHHFKHFTPEFLRWVLGDDLFHDLECAVCINCWSSQDLVWRYASTGRLVGDDLESGLTTCFPCAVSQGDISIWGNYCVIKDGQIEKRKACLWCMSLHAPREGAECRDKYERVRTCGTASKIFRFCITVVAFSLSTAFLPGDVRAIVATAVSTPACFVGLLILTRACKLAFCFLLVRGINWCFNVSILSDVRKPLLAKFFMELFNSCLAALPISSILTRPSGRWSRGMMVALAFLCLHL